MIKNLYSLLFLILLLLPVGFHVQAETCRALPSDKQPALIDYVRKQYKIGESTDLRLTKTEDVTSSCYRSLVFEGQAPGKTWQLTLYLSPDQRFLTTELLDTTLDPIKEEKRKTEVLMAGLVPNYGSSRGLETAPVTIVEFSDFECPFCRQFTELIEQLTPAEKNQVRIIFHHLPLSIHPWARAAAEGAACAQFQSSTAFWAIHDQIFHHQLELSPTNIKGKLLEYSHNSDAIDSKSFQSCLDNEMSLGLVLKDMNLASASNVQGTPTLFVNGQRIPGVKDIGQLRRIISEAKGKAVVAAASETGLLEGTR